MEEEKSKQEEHFLCEFLAKRDPMICNKLDIYMDLPFRLLQEDLTPCYTKMSGATVLQVHCPLDRNYSGL